MSIIDPFRSRLVLSNTLIALLGLTLVVVVFSVLLAQRSYAIRRQDLQAQSQHLALRIEQLYRQRSSYKELIREVYFASKILRERVVVLSPEGRVAVDSKKGTPFFGNAPFQYSLAAFHNAQSARQVLAGPVMGFQSPIHGTGGARNGGAVVLIARVNDVRPDLGSLIGVIVAAAGAVFLVWVLISLYFAVFVSRPLQRIAAAAGRMSRGEYDVRVPDSGPGEIGQLAMRFNVMAG
ncbi:MAG TPA: HAMP domain-containing protein, partial [Chloroflexota bacterium]|nr:HAMP domain-containing protein [Chloroflexota bacterium]